MAYSSVSKIVNYSLTEVITSIRWSSFALFAVVSLSFESVQFISVCIFTLIEARIFPANLIDRLTENKPKWNFRIDLEVRMIPNCRFGLKSLCFSI